MKILGFTIQNIGQQNRFIVILFILFSMCCNALLQAQQTEFIPKSFIIKFKPKNSKLKSTPQSLGISTQKVEAFINSLKPIMVKQKFPKAKLPVKPNDVDITTIYEIKYLENYPVDKIVAYLSTFDVVQYVQPIPVNQLFYTPNDPLIGNQWYVDKIELKQAWDISKGDTNVVIAISDTGVNVFHEDLVGQIKYNWADPINGVDDDNDGYIDNYRGWDMAGNDNNPYEASAPHGTTVAGIAGAKTDNGKGVVGVGFNCKILPVRSDLQTTLTGFEHDYESIVYAADHGANVINCSWGSLANLPYGQDIVNYATYNKDALVVCAAGNFHRPDIIFPASYEHAISVACVNENDCKWFDVGTINGSAYGFYVDASAPGVNIWTTDGNSYKKQFVGTSLSAPIFSGIAGLVRSFNPKYNALQAGERVRISSQNIDTVPTNAPFAKLLGHGRVNAYHALIDSLKPSIRLVDYSIAGLYDNIVRGGDTAVLKGSFVNYLHYAKNITISVSDYNGYLAQVDVIPVIDSLGMMDTVKNFELKFSLNKSIPYDATVALQITYDTPDGFHDIQFVVMKANPSYLPLEANDISTSVTANGCMGYTYVSNYEGIGFNYKNNPIQYNGNYANPKVFSGLVLAKDSVKVLTYTVLPTSFTPSNHPEYENTDSTVSIVSSLNGKYKNDVDFNFKINQRATSWLNDSSFVLYEYDIINTSLADIDSMYAGLIMDWDVGNPFWNKAYANSNKKYGYVYSIDQTQPYVGVKVLKGDSVNQHLIEVYDNIKELKPKQVMQGDTLMVTVYDTTTEFIQIDPKKGLTKDNIFTALTHSKTNLNLVQRPADDIIQVINVKAKDIKIGDTLHVAFALFVASKEQNIPKVLSRAEFRYKQEHHLPTGIVDVQQTITKLKIVPNITSGNTVSVEFESSKVGKVRVTISDNQGRIVKSFKQIIESGRNSFPISDIKQAGLYYVTVEMNGETFTEKFVKE